MIAWIVALHNFCVQTEGSATSIKTYEISKWRDFWTDFLISISDFFISADFTADFKISNIFQISILISWYLLWFQDFFRDLKISARILRFLY